MAPGKHELKHFLRSWLHCLNGKVMLASLVFVSLSGQLVFAKTNQQCRETVARCGVTCSDTDTTCNNADAFRVKAGQVSPHEEHTYRVLFGRCYSDLTECGFVESSGTTWKKPKWYRKQKLTDPQYSRHSPGSLPKSLKNIFGIEFAEPGIIDPLWLLIVRYKYFSIYDKPAVFNLIRSVVTDAKQQLAKGMKPSELKNRLNLLTYNFMACRGADTNLSYWKDAWEWGNSL